MPQADVELSPVSILVGYSPLHSLKNIQIIRLFSTNSILLVKISYSDLWRMNSSQYMWNEFVNFLV